MADPVPTFAQIADAMAKIKAQEDANPPPSAAAKQAMEAAWETLKDALADIALEDFGAAADAVGDAAKQLQGVIDSGTANADPIQQIIGALGFANKAPAGPAAPAAQPSGTTGGSTVAPTLSDRVPIPPRDQINVGLSACAENTMLNKFGRPGDLTADCSPATGPFLRRVRQRFDVGPFKVTGLDYAVESLLQVFSDVRKDNHQLYDQVKNEGMLCVRARRHNPSHYSNHSWGTAIDIFFGSDVVPQGVRLAHRGNLLLAPYFNRHGWYWGAGFSGDSVDSMHFELAEETIAKIPDEPLFDEHVSPPLAAAAAEGLAAPEGFQTDPVSKRLLGDIVAALNTAKPVKQSFNGVTFAAKLPDGELVFQSELQLDTDGWPDGKNQGDSTWQPTTSLRYSNGGSVNANTVPYFVLPQTWYGQFGIKVGDLGAVVYKDKLAFAVFADVGPKSKLGEGSLQLLRQLGEERLRPNGRIINSGMGGGVTTLVFPGSKADTGYQDEKSLLSHIQARGQVLFLQLGGYLPSELQEA
jgi:hypothetical protein